MCLWFNILIYTLMHIFLCVPTQILHINLASTFVWSRHGEEQSISKNTSSIKICTIVAVKNMCSLHNPKIFKIGYHYLSLQILDLHIHNISKLQIINGSYLTIMTKRTTRKLLASVSPSFFPLFLAMLNLR